MRYGKNNNLPTTASTVNLRDVFPVSVKPVICPCRGNTGWYESSEGKCCYCSPSEEGSLAFLSAGGIPGPSLGHSETETRPFFTTDSVLNCFDCFIPLFLCRESRRKTPVAVSLKENERLFGDSALGMVRVLVSHRAICSSCTQKICSLCWVLCAKCLS